MSSEFAELGLAKPLLQAIEQLGYRQPTPVQEKVIPLLLAGQQDIVGLAQTGTGKTAAFGLPLVQQIKGTEKLVKALVLCPTRELCTQVCRDIEGFATELKHVRVAAVYGGASIEAQARALQKGAQIIVATPGRMLDLLRRKKADISRIHTLVLDEADEMLNIGFREELTDILEQAPQKKRTLLFSATFSKDIARIASYYLVDPVEISAGQRNVGASNISYTFYQVPARQKYAALKRVIDINPAIYGIVFCRTRKETKDIAESLIKDGYNADSLHGDLSQAQREYVMKKFRLKNLKVLIATDVAARGLDVNDLTHVINYALPDEPETYTHRSGRTARAGKKGTCVALVHGRELGRLRRIEKAVGRPFEQKDLPTPDEVIEKQLFHYTDRVARAEVKEEQLAPFMPKLIKQLAWLEREQLIKQMVSLEFNRILAYYEKAPDLNQEAAKAPARKKPRKSKQQHARLFLNAGNKQNMSPKKLMSLVNRFCETPNIGFGTIEVKRTITFFEVEKTHAKEVQKSLQGKSVGGIKLDVTPAEAEKKSKRKG